MSFDDFDAEIQSEEASEGQFDDLCLNCGTNHSNLEEEKACVTAREAEMREFKQKMHKDICGEHDSIFSRLS